MKRALAASRKSARLKPARITVTIVRSNGHRTKIDMPSATDPQVASAERFVNYMFAGDKTKEMP